MFKNKKDKKITVAIIGTRGIPNRYGGFEQCAEHLGPGLAELGYKVYVYSPHEHPYKKNEYKGVSIVRRWCPETHLGSFAHIIYDAICLIDAVVRRFDIIIELGYGTAAPSLLLPRFRTRVVTNMDGLEWRRDKWSRNVKRFMRAMEALSVKRSDWLISDNIGIKEYLKSTYNCDSSFIPYGANVRKVNISSEIIKKYRVPSRYCLCVARIEPENNIDAIIRGFLDSEIDATLLVVGGVSNAYAKSICKIYESDSVHFIGSVYDRDALDQMRNGAIAYIHGHSVGGTNPALLEAMAVGSFIIAHNNEFNRTVLRDAGEYFSDYASLSSILRRTMTSDLSEKRKMAMNYIIENYTWESVVGAYAKLINSQVEYREITQCQPF